MSFISGPIAPESNPPIEPQNFQPSVFPILGISFGIVTVVTLGMALHNVSNNYVIGQQVRFDIPKSYGAQQLSGQQGLVISIPGANQIAVNINTTIGYDPFISSPSYNVQKPQMVAIGDVNSGPINANGLSNQATFIKGSFINISPVQAG